MSGLGFGVAAVGNDGGVMTPDEQLLAQQPKPLQSPSGWFAFAFVALIVAGAAASWSTSLAGVAGVVAVLLVVRGARVWKARRAQASSS